MTTSDVRPTPTRPKATATAEASVRVVAAVALGLLAFFMARYLWHGFRYPIGPDAPVYVWWARLASVDGLSAVDRPGIASLALVVRGTLGMSPSQIFAGLGGVLGAATGLAAGSLARTGDRSKRAAFVLAGVLAGTFAAHLAGGYFANLAFAALFLTAAALLATKERPAALAAAGLIAAAGLAHPLFLPIGVLILLLSLPFGRLRGPESKNILLATFGGAAVAGLGLLTLLGGPRPIDAPTSKDGYLRALGFQDRLEAAYLARLGQHWLRYIWPITLPLAAVGAWKAKRFVGRFLRGWFAVALVGVVFALITARYPAERMLTFAFVLPIGAALGLLRFSRWLQAKAPRPVAVAIVGVSTIAILAGAVFTWAQTRPFVDDELAAKAAGVAGAALEAEPGTPIIVATDANGDAVAFDGALVGNIQRAAMDVDQIRDVRVLLGEEFMFAVSGRANVSGEQIHDALVRASYDELAALEGSWTMTAASRVTGATIGVPQDPQPLNLRTQIAPYDDRLTEAPAGSPWAPTPPWMLVGGAFAMLGLFTAVGYGWSRWVAGSQPGGVRLALAPALGIAALLLGGFLLDRLGIRLTGVWPAVVTLLTGGAGYALAALGERRVAPGAAEQVDE